jgi:hypothetical protein
MSLRGGERAFAEWQERADFQPSPAKELAGYGVGRKAGATTTFQDTDGTVELILTDGKVTGPVTMSTGDWASFNGKTWFWTAKSTGRYTSELYSTLK